MKFVKLGLADPNNCGEPLFYRRIPMGIDTNRNGGISFLKRHAVLLARNEETGDIRNVNLNDYTVQLYYRDSESDYILLCTDTDVMYAMQGVVGVTATVKITAKVDDAKPNSTKATQTATPSTTETATQEPAPAPVPTNNVVEALEDVLHCVVASANAAMAASVEQAQVRSTPEVEPPVSSPVGRSGSTIFKAARTSSEALKMALEQAAAHTSKATHVAVKAAHYAEKKVDKAFVKAEKHVNKAVEKAERQLAKTERKIEEALAAISKAAHEEPRSATAAHSNDVTSPSSEPAAATAGPEPEVFIHGRHTCDACLTTPIIGDRYHATNMLDYDLCAKCHDQYKGSEIKFEVATLDRDASMQERWRRKYARMNCGNVDHHSRPNRRCAPRARFAHRGPPAHHHVPAYHGPSAMRGPSSFGPGPWTSVHMGPQHDYGGFDTQDQRATDAGFYTSGVVQPDVDDIYMTSCPDNGTKAPDAGQDQRVPDAGLFASNVDKYNDEALEQALRRSLEDMGLTTSPAVSSMEAPRASAPKEEEVYETAEVEIAAPPSAPPVYETEVEIAVPPSAPPVYETEVEIAVAPGAPRTSNGVVVETVAPEEACNEEASVAEVAVQESITLEAVGAVEVPAIVNAPTEQMAVEVPVESYDRVPKIPASQAAYVKDSHENESVTEAGQTIVSGKSEYTGNAASSSPNTAAGINTSFVEQDSGSTENFLGETLDRVANAIDNLMIVDGADDDDEEETESQDSWSVVNDDENLARAAEMIGSALFNSDNNVGSTISSVSSAPTHVTNFVNQALFHRWSHHLERLHELGFEDDVKNIAALEMLMAANIGVEAFNEDVTLEQVVNTLMNGY